MPLKFVGDFQYFLALYCSKWLANIGFFFFEGIRSPSWDRGKALAVWTLRS